MDVEGNNIVFEPFETKLGLPETANLAEAGSLALLAVAALQRHTERLVELRQSPIRHDYGELGTTQSMVTAYIGIVRSLNGIILSHGDATIDASAADYVAKVWSSKSR